MVINFQAVIWFALVIVLVVIEAVTMGLTTIWFAAGSLVAFVLALLQASFAVQFIAFGVISVVLLIFTRPAASKWLNRTRTKTNAESLIGETAVVTETIDNIASTGQVQIHGQYWTARASENDKKIEKDKKVTVEQINGVKLIVTEV